MYDDRVVTWEQSKKQAHAYKYFYIKNLLQLISFEFSLTYSYIHN